MGSQSSKQVNPQQEVFFANSTQKHTLADDTQPKQPIQLQFAIKHADYYSQYFLSVYISDSQQSKGKFLGKTEIQQVNEDRNVIFNMGFIIDYFFEKQQILSICLTKGMNECNIVTTVGGIMGSRGQTYAKQIDNSSEILVISANEMKNVDTNLSVKIGIESVNMDTTMYYQIRKYKNKIGGNKKEMINLYKSEVKGINKFSANVEFTQFAMPLSVLCQGEYDYPFAVEYYDMNYEYPLFVQEATVDTFLSNANRAITLCPKKNASVKIVNKSHISKDYTFISYLRGGMQLALTIGIDFTGSNGHPLDQISLHYVGSSAFNSYEKAIRSCGDIIAYYDYDQMFPVYGFGAMLPGNPNVLHCFHLNLTRDPNIYTIDNVLNAYRSAIKNLSFSGPTFFAPLIRQAIANIKSQGDQMIYHILLILTDGIINDMQDTIDALVEGSYLPLSVIIVGIGRTDFSNMNILDADDNPLFDRKGRKAGRDLVQFVPFFQYENDGPKLASQVLEEVPRQVVEYYAMINRPPGDPVVSAYDNPSLK